MWRITWNSLTEEERRPRRRRNATVKPKTVKPPACDAHLQGRVIGQLTVVRYHGGRKWECRCSCGRTTYRRRGVLIDAINRGWNSRCIKCQNGNPMWGIPK